MIESTDFRVGEKKEVLIKIRSMCRKPIEVTDATFELTIGEETEAIGDCEVRQISGIECILSALIQPMRKNAIYDLTYHYTIYPEELVYSVHVRVT